MGRTLMRLSDVRSKTGKKHNTLAKTEIICPKNVGAQVAMNFI